MPEATALEDIQSNLIENKREVLSEGGQSDHANERTTDPDDQNVTPPEMLNAICP